MRSRLRSFLFIPLWLAATAGCSKQQLPPAPPTATAPALDTSAERDISYLFEREENGKAVAVSEDYQFKGGDRFRLRFRPGFPAYIYVANHGTGEASYRMLFPLAAERGRNPLAKGAAVALPGDSDWLHFDESPGNEYLVLIASTVALPELENDGAQIGRDDFEAILANISRRYRPESSRRFHDGDWIKFFAAREGALAIVVRLALQHQ